MNRWSVLLNDRPARRLSRNALGDSVNNKYHDLNEKKNKQTMTDSFTVTALTYFNSSSSSLSLSASSFMALFGKPCSFFLSHFWPLLVSLFDICTVLKNDISLWSKLC